MMVMLRGLLVLMDRLKGMNVIKILVKWVFFLKIVSRVVRMLVVV